MATAAQERSHRLNARLRDEERVTPLELFFDLVFVLAITQCTALMADHTTWSGVAQGLLVLAMLWWAWGGYAWLTSVVDPEEGAVRLVIFAAMAAFLIVALCVPKAFGSLGLEFAIAYGFVRYGQIALFILASRDDPGLRHSVIGLALSTAVGVGLLVAASFVDGLTQGGLWALAVALDLSGPLIIDSSGWRLMPAHFAERHGLIIIIALGESIVALGAGANVGFDAGVAAAAILGTTLAAGLWWVYFDVVAIVAARRLAAAPPGKVQNEMARDSYSYIHLPMVAGIVLTALGLKKTLLDVGGELHTVPAFALLGGVAIYLLALVAFRWRHVHTLNRQRLALALVLLAVFPLATKVPAIWALAIPTVVLAAMIVYETRSYGEGRERVRHEGTFTEAS
jgi:low temperature requirement protein LtrA